MKHYNRRHALLLAGLGLFGFSSIVSADEGCCTHCRCCQSCQKVCRLVREDKKVSVTCWGCVCEDFCLPSPSRPGCRHCEEVCADGHEPCDPKQPCAAPKRFIWTEWFPGCAREINTKTKLMNKVVTKTVPSYKWVVEDLCPKCEEKCETAEIHSGAEIPSPPAIAGAKLKPGRSDEAEKLAK